ncbi:hypothetical protein [Ancylobacter lacus]|uniref:hypothetical protein n=1 Tax=Ancylobacter lacus TaxID=2579970 RepID=UPI001BCBDE81|nr:hypothetical protein [Ancylobacter lacus]MBS7540723.1 hypothetical protein [Ancylobacter lacus]
MLPMPDASAFPAARPPAATPARAARRGAVAARRHRFGRPSPLVAAALLLPALLPARALAAQSCMRACISGRMNSGDDDLALRNTLRACRDTCLAEEKAALERDGLPERYAGCKATPVSPAEFRALRSANAGFTVHTNVLLWEFTNTLPDKVIRSVEVSTQTMSLSDAAFTTRTLIPPGRTATIVVMDFFDGYPNARFAAKLSRVEACPLQ